MSRLPAAAEAPLTQDGNVMATDSESIDNQASNVAGGNTGNGGATGSCTAKSPGDIQSGTSDANHPESSHGTSNTAPTKPGEATPNQTIAASTSHTHGMTHATGLDGSKNVVKFNNKYESEPTCTAVASTQPVGIYYPPRRPNIFRARAKHLRFPEFDRHPVASDAVDKSEGAMEDDGEGFSLKDLEELQSESKQKMEKQTESFKRMVQQTVWHSRVEDLGTVQEIEE